ncbi:MAG: preprotein translocase subunit YajC [Muribaculaceae bacterium]|nr:preprotein translocase subunit YajC [Muribaculaceae bacterium]MDE6564397.1 preprotein translocase subunit YajC [Muribaculaceae bacterium]
MLNYILLDGAQAAGGGMGSILMIVALFVVFYFFMIRPQQKRQKEIKKFREALDKGDKIVTAGGIYGTIREVKDTYFIIEIDKDVRIRVDKGSVYPSAEEANQAAQNSDQQK